MMLNKERSRIFLQASWRCYESNAGVEVGSVIQGKRLRMDGISYHHLAGILGDLFHGVDAHSAVRVLSRRYSLSSSCIEELLTALDAQGALIAATEERRSEYSPVVRYDRQIRFFTAFETERLSGADINDKLRDSQICIVGLGGYGSWLALLFAQLGIKKIFAIDGDHVEESNLTRQALYDEKDIGESKVRVVQSKLADINQQLKFEGRDQMIESTTDMIRYFQERQRQIDLVLNPFGYTSFYSGSNRIFWIVAEAALQTQLPSLAFGGSWVGPLNIPQQSPCVGCLMSQEEVSTLVDASDPHMRVASQVMPAIAPRIAATASVAVWEATRFLAELDNVPSINSLLAVDTLRYEDHSRWSISFSNTCPLCRGKGVS